MKTLEDVIIWETVSCNFVMSYIYSWFPKYHIWICKRKYNRYLGFKEYERQMYDKTGEYLNKYFGQ
jgi:hypothetical protein